MKPVPLVLLLASVLLASHVRPSAGRPRTLPAGRFKGPPDEAFLGAAGGGAAVSSYLLGVLRVLQGRTSPNVRSADVLLSPFPFVDELAVAAPQVNADAEALSHLLAAWETELRGPGAGGSERGGGNRLDQLVLGLSKRNDDPPISIDLTFHLLRNMIEMAKIESQKEQAQLNRKFLDEVGK
ncbi:hypothetical protein NHX12_025942 [Muraenolepis orangiensis]|uniref:Corticotropin-releasing factor domain-containing protein n=1 Tax=Muraenolepis orangiensis TaxID=630683 RepID=A0A9Q0EIP6_9TELE|nr:hypothetical protein NHX12_025942 [Muraenolepis orangiensis]